MAGSINRLAKSTELRTAILTLDQQTLTSTFKYQVVLKPQGHFFLGKIRSSLELGATHHHFYKFSWHLHCVSTWFVFLNHDHISPRLCSVSSSKHFHMHWSHVSGSHKITVTANWSRLTIKLDSGHCFWCKPNSELLHQLPRLLFLIFMKENKTFIRVVSTQ